MKPRFLPCNNIAIKFPTHEYDDTVVFYRDRLCLEQSASQAEIWLEIITDDLEKATQYLNNKQCTRKDEIEPFAEGFRGFWISSPYNIIHLISQESV